MVKLKGFSKSDLILLVLVSIAAVFTLGYQHQNSSAQRHGGIELAKIVRIQGKEIYFLMAKDFFWNKGQEQQSLGENDSIMTGNDTTVEIQLGQSKIVLQPNTLLKLTGSRRLRFQDGEIQVYGKDIEIKTNVLVHKIDGAAQLKTIEDVDQVKVETGVHQILPDTVVDSPSEIAPQEPVTPEVLSKDIYVEKNWLNDQSSQIAFFKGSSYDSEHLTRELQKERPLKERIVLNHKEIDATFYYPLGNFNEEFSVENGSLVNRRLFNGELKVNGKIFDAISKNRIKLTPKENTITVTTPFQSKTYNYYIDEEPADIQIKMKEYVIEVPQTSESQPKEILPKDKTTEEEEEEEQRGILRLSWEASLKDNQIYLVRIKTEDGKTILEDFAEENHYDWASPTSGTFQLEVAIKSTVTQKILKSQTSEIKVLERKREPPEIKTTISNFLAAGSTYIGNSTRQSNKQNVKTSGMGPLSLRYRRTFGSFYGQAETSLFFADVNNGKTENLFNNKLMAGFGLSKFKPAVAFQNNQMIVQENDLLKLKTNNMWLAGGSYHLDLTYLDIAPFYFYNFGSLRGNQLGMEFIRHSAWMTNWSVVLRAEYNYLRNARYENLYSQFTLLLGKNF